MADTYTSDYATLDDLASGVNDDPAVEIRAGTPLKDSDVVAASVQYKTRKALSAGGQATAAELAAARKRKFCIEAENAGIGSGGPVDQQVLLHTVQQSLRDFTAAINHPEHGLRALHRRLDITEARSKNLSSVKSKTDPIGQLPNVEGERPPVNHWFPENDEAIINATLKQLNDLLGFYDLPGGHSKADKQKNLRAHLGVSYSYLKTV